MSKAKKIAIAISLAVVATGYTVFSLRSPDNYEDCIFMEMKSAQSDKAAIAIAGACRKKFPEKNYFDKYDKEPQ